MNSTDLHLWGDKVKKTRELLKLVNHGLEGRKGEFRARVSGLISFFLDN